MNIEMDLGLFDNHKLGYIAASKYSTNKSDAEVINVTVNLYAALAQDWTTTVTFSGGHSQLENYGVGQHYAVALVGSTIANPSYNVTTVTLTIPAGDTSAIITMTIIDNQTIELDRDITISAPLFGAAKTVTIVDDNRDYVIDVTDPHSGWSNLDNATYALVGGSSSADAAKFVLLTAYLNTNNKKSVLYFPDNTYVLGKNSYTYPNQSIVGQSRSGTIIQRQPDGLSRFDTSELIISPVCGAQVGDHDPFAISNLTLHGGDLPVARLMTFSSTPAEVPHDGDSFKFAFENSAGVNINDTYYFKTTPVDLTKDIQIGATVAATVANMKTLLETPGNGYTCTYKTGSIYQISVTHTTYYGFGTSSNFSESVNHMTWTTNEHCHMLGLTGNITNTGRGVHKIENVYLTSQKCAEVITGFANSDGNIYRATDLANGTEYFARGMIALGGGYCINRVKDVECQYFHCEQDSPGYDDGLTSKNYGATYIYDLTAVTAFYTAYTLDSILDVRRNIITGVTNFVGPGNGTFTGSIVFTDCDFTWDSSYYAGDWSNVGENTIVNTSVFRTGNAVIGSTGMCLIVNLNPSPSTFNDQKITFNDCHFDPGTGIATNKYGVYNSGIGGWAVRNNSLVFNDCHFLTGLLAPVGHASAYGGIFTFNDCIYDCYYGMYMTSSTAVTTTHWKYTINGGTFTNITRFAYIYNNGGGVENRLYLNDISITNTQNVITWQTPGYATLNVARVDAGAGIMRTITGGDPAAGGPGFYKIVGGGVYTTDAYDKSPAKHTTAAYTWAAD
jgi:hypothetical protein